MITPITRRDVIAHQLVVPWPSQVQVEQDLLLCRAMVTLFDDAFLQGQIAMRGGTLLHKVHLAPASGDRINVELSVEPSSGRLDMMINDRSYSGNQLVDMTYATSSDGGHTWRTARVTPVGFDPSTWGVPSSSALGYRPFIGDYNGIVSTATTAGLTWTGFADPQPYNLEVDFASATP